MQKSENPARARGALTEITKSDSGIIAPAPFLRTRDLARRWGVREQTVRAWRYRGTGPRYVRLSPTLVAYALADVLEYERARTFASTSEETVRAEGRP